MKKASVALLEAHLKMAQDLNKIIGGKEAGKAPAGKKTEPGKKEPGKAEGGKK